MIFPLSFSDLCNSPAAVFRRIHERRLTMFLLATLWLVFGVTSTIASADDDGRRLIRVEEDWVALIAQPDPSTSSPQILNVISPRQSTSDIFGLIQVNHRDQPFFSDGGLQVQARRGSELIGTAQSNSTATLSRWNDSLRYTIAMQLTETGIRFELLNGSSRTWGRFAQTPVTVAVADDGATLENYSPEFSAANTCVNLGAHRIEILYLNTTRRTFDDGEVVTDTSDRVLHRYQLRVEDVSREEYEQNPGDYTMEITEDLAPTGP